MQSLYDPEAVRPMWEELAQVGIKPLTTPEEVDAFMSRKEGTALLVINSVCGCAAGGARPGVMRALQNERIPDEMGTVFAGVDRLAVERAREHLGQFAPSSPFIALFKDGQPVFVLERQHIEQMDVPTIVHYLVKAFNEHCRRPGPSVPHEVFEQLVPVQRCSSTIPLYRPS